MSRFFEEIARAYLVLKKDVPFPFYFDLIVLYLQGPPDISININTYYNSSSSGIILIVLTFLYFPQFRVQSK